ncbi:hypothetical protein V9T40_007023 [Parthenolecanium corni]|uniref:CCHC-type domain-containing protein n=1 Tax=Parthenolecanium corni TaxID=536013 RepID=A0AAN9YBR4_9HEMI
MYGLPIIVPNARNCFSFKKKRKQSLVRRVVRLNTPATRLIYIESYSISPRSVNSSFTVSSPTVPEIVNAILIWETVRKHIMEAVGGEEGVNGASESEHLPTVRRSKRKSGPITNLRPLDSTGASMAECEAPPQLFPEMEVMNGPKVKMSASEPLSQGEVPSTLVQIPFNTLANMLNAGTEVNSVDREALSVLYKKIEDILRKKNNDALEEEEALLRSEDEEVVVDNVRNPDAPEVPQVSDSANGREQNTQSQSCRTELSNSFVNSVEFTELVHAVSEQLGGSRSQLFPSVRETGSLDGVRPLSEMDIGTKGLRYIVKKDTLPNIPPFELDKRKQTVRDIIINEIDDRFHSKVVTLSEPKEILKILEVYKKREINVTSCNVRKRLNNLRYDPKKTTAAQFIEKFEDLVRNYENLDERHDLSEAEKTDAFFNAVKWGLPSVAKQQFNYRMLTDKPLTHEGESGPVALLTTLSRSGRGKRSYPRPWNRSSTSSSPPKKLSRQNNLNTLKNNKSLQKGFKQSSPSSFSQQRRGVRCFNCQRRGHMGKDCQNPARSNVCFRLQAPHRQLFLRAQNGNKNQPRTGLIDTRGQALMVRPNLEYVPNVPDASGYYAPVQNMYTPAPYVSSPSDEPTYTSLHNMEPPSPPYPYNMVPTPVLGHMVPFNYYHNY